MKRPLHDATPFAWFAYADFLEERGDQPKEWLRALEIACGLERTPKLALVAYGFNSPLAFLQPGKKPPYEEWYFWERYAWWTVKSIYRRWDGVHVPQYFATPADFPGLIEERPALANAFYAKVSRGFKAYVGGSVFQYFRSRRILPVNCRPQSAPSPLKNSSIED